MKAVFLIIDYVPHQVLSIRTLIEKTGAEVLAFHVGRSYKYIPSDLRNFSTFQYQSCSKEELLDVIKSFQPDILVTAGWMISEYNWVCKQIKKVMSIPIAAMSDTPWRGNLKQKINAVIGPFHVKKAFTHLWVSGIMQYEYARRLGFSNQQIIFNSLSADIGIFQQVDIRNKADRYPKNFLYIGRYTEIKGLANLIQAWAAINDKRGWTFTLIGAGKMKDELERNGQFIVKDYMTQDKLLREMQNAGCFVLPSLKEPWALVIHEAAAAGLPLLCTEICGAGPHFVINNYNGFRIRNNSVEDLKDKLETIIRTNNSELLEYSKRSKELSNSINPDIHVASLMQLINAY